MRRWNGWGEEDCDYPLAPEAIGFIRARLGVARPLPDASLDGVLATVPPSRLPPHPLILSDALTRVRHARGQSLPDWLAMRSGVFGCFPDGVAFPECVADIETLFAYAQRHDVLLIPYGGGTSVVGHINPPVSRKPLLTVAMKKINQLIDLDSTSLIAEFGAGVSGPELEAQLRARGFMLGHFPQSFELSTLGGWVASRSSGQQSLRYGRIEQLFAGATLVTPAGVLDIAAIPASAAGPDIREMVLGSEGRFGILASVKVRIRALPPKEQFHVAFLPSWERGVQAMRELAQQAPGLSMLRLANPVETRTQLALAGHPRQVQRLERYLAWRGAAQDKCMMTYGVTGSSAQVGFARREAARIIRSFGGVGTGQTLGRKWAQGRFRSAYLRETLWQLGYAADTLETAVNWERVPATADAIEAALREGLGGEPVHAFTHLSHVYRQGSSIYTTYLFRVAEDYPATLERWSRLKERASRVIVQAGGTISHQHGVGADHAPYLGAEKGELGLRMIRQLCLALDPEQRMNPGKLVVDVAEHR
jgi:alkyldihydroxyacetonephosphate synthase